MGDGRRANVHYVDEGRFRSVESVVIAGEKHFPHEGAPRDMTRKVGLPGLLVHIIDITGEPALVSSLGGVPRQVVAIATGRQRIQSINTSPTRRSSNVFRRSLHSSPTRASCRLRDDITREEKQC